LNLTLNHLPELQGRQGKDFFYSLFPEETKNAESPLELIYAEPFTVRSLRFTSTTAGSKLTKRISSVTRGS